MQIEPCILDEPFSPCAFEALIIESKKINGWPDSEKVKRTAYKIFEDEKKKNHADIGN